MGQVTMSQKSTMGGPCCQGDMRVTQVDIFGDGRMVGLVGLKAAFEQLMLLGQGPEDTTGDEADYWTRKSEAEE